MDSHKNPTQKWILLVVIIILLGGLVAFLISRRAEIPDADDAVPEVVAPKTTDVPVTPSTTTETSTTATSVPATPSVLTEPEAQQVGYKDGTYQAVGNYVSPGGAESIDVTLVVKDNAVTDASFVSKAKNPTAKNWQERFIDNVKGEVVGKKLDALNLKVVSGSSLTPVGFMDAVAKIKVQAKV